MSSRWVKGQSGNPKGRPKKELSERILHARNLIEADLDKLVKKCIEMALGGDMKAMQLCLERVLPARQEIDVPQGLVVRLVISDEN